MIFRVKYDFSNFLGKKTICKFKLFEDPISAEIKRTLPIKIFFTKPFFADWIVFSGG